MADADATPNAENPTDPELQPLVEAKIALEAALTEWFDIEKNVLPLVKKGVAVPGLGQRVGDAQFAIACGLDTMKAILDATPPGPFCDEVTNLFGNTTMTYNALIVGILFGRYQRAGVQSPYERLLRDAYRLVQGTGK